VEVPDPLVVVAVELEVVDELVVVGELEVDDEDDVVVLVGVEEVVSVVELVVVEVVVDVTACWWHSETAWSASLETPSFRLVVSERLTVGGRFAASFRSDAAAFSAAAQLPDWTAVDTESRAAWRLFAWSPESRPAPPPQATRDEAARPSPPARSARGAKRIRGVTLEARSVAVALAGARGSLAVEQPLGE
jgi:hypothetical protein